jgi:3-oxoadipate enol-lactonase
MEFVSTGRTEGPLVLHALRQGGDQGVPLVFINSLGTDLRIWDAVVAELGRRRPGTPLIRHDKRGHGLSDCPSAPYTISDHAEDLRRLLESFSVVRAVLIGISVGGMIALELAARHPELVEALVLADTAARIGSEESWQARVALVREEGMARAGESIAPRWFARGFAESRPAEYRGYLNMLCRTPAEGYIGTCHALRDADLGSDVPGIRQPALVLCGSEDAATPPELMGKLARGLPRARFELIEGAGHLPCVEQPERMAELIHRFLEEATDG